MILVIGPPGAGKTTVLANWLEARRIRRVWRQIDPREADLATIFSYPAQASPPCTRRGKPSLPALTPKYLP